MELSPPWRACVNGDFNRLKSTFVHDDEGFSLRVIVGVSAGESAEDRPVHCTKSRRGVRHAVANYGVDNARQQGLPTRRKNDGT